MVLGWKKLNDKEVVKLLEFLGFKDDIEKFFSERHDNVIFSTEHGTESLPATHTIRGGKYRIKEGKNGIEYEVKVDKGAVHVFFEHGRRAKEIYQPRHPQTYKKKIRF